MSARSQDDSTPVAGTFTSKGFRLDLQGLRGIGLIFLFVGHASVPHLRGGFVGLDLFYVLSGFLITFLIVREMERTDTVSVLRFWARRVRRLLPLAMTVLAFVIVVSAMLYGPTRNEQISRDVLAAALYVVNWRFIFQQVDYFEEGETVSPVQHYWSLSVEEQFYIVWPLLLLATCVLARRFGVNLRLALGLVMAPLGIASLAYSISYSPTDPDAAYFSTLTRGWQLVLGGLLAVTLPLGLRMAKSLCSLLTIGGLATLAITCVWFDEQTIYPGWKGLLPSLAVAGLIIAGTTTQPSWAMRILMRQPLQYMGKVSYSFYLWHWPAIIIGEEVWGPLTWQQRALAELISFIPAIATHYLIEERFRTSPTLARRPRLSLGTGAAITGTAVVLALTLSAIQPKLDTAPTNAILGAQARAEPPPKRISAVRPAPADARKDRGRYWEDGCLTTGKDRHSDECVYGVEDSDTTVVVFGDSHALQYFPAMRILARKHRWRLVGLTRASCPIADVNYQPTCNAWRENTMRRIIDEERPDLIVTSSGTLERFRVVIDDDRISRRASQRYLERGQTRTLERLQRTGAAIAVIRDQAAAPFNMADCVAENSRDLGDCTFEPERPEWMAFDARGVEAMRKPVKLIDPMPVLCPKRRCPAVMGNALVYRDVEHLSATFARTLAPWLDRQLPEPKRRRLRRAGAD